MARALVHELDAILSSSCLMAERPYDKSPVRELESWRQISLEARLMKNGTFGLALTGKLVSDERANRLKFESYLFC